MLTFRELQLTQISLNFQNSCCNLKVRGLGAKLCMTFLLLLFWKELWCFKVKESILFIEKKYKFWYKRNRIENPTLRFREINLLFSLYENCKLKVKLQWVRARERKKSAVFVTFILSEGNFFNIYALSQCIAYWINFQNLSTFVYQKLLLYALLSVVFKIIKSLHYILK